MEQYTHIRAAAEILLAFQSAFIPKVKCLCLGGSNCATVCCYIVDSILNFEFLVLYIVVTCTCFYISAENLLIKHRRKQ